MTYYVVSEERLEYLEKQTLLMEALECGGVDNWADYGPSIEIMEDANDVDDMYDLVDLDERYQEVFDWTRDTLNQLTK